MNKKSQMQYVYGAIVVFFLIIFSQLLFQSIKDVSCVNEKKTIDSLNSQISKCQTDLSVEKQNVQQKQNELTDCQNQLSETQKSLKNCTESYNKLEEEYKKKEQPIKQYYFIKIYNNKTILFDLIVIYHIEMVGLFLSFGVTLTIKLFEVDIEIKVLNKKNQRKLIKAIREYLIKYPWAPVVMIIGIIAVHNLIVLI